MRDFLVIYADDNGIEQPLADGKDEDEADGVGKNNASPERQTGNFHRPAIDNGAGVQLESGARKISDEQKPNDDNFDFNYGQYEYVDMDRRRKIGHTVEMLPFPKTDKLGMSPLPISHADVHNLRNERQSWQLVSPPHSAVVYRIGDIRNVFLALLILQVVFVIRPIRSRYTQQVQFHRNAKFYQTV